MVIYFGNPYVASEKIIHPANSKFIINAAQMRCEIRIQCDWKKAIEISKNNAFSIEVDWCCCCHHRSDEAGTKVFRRNVVQQLP
jgi:hypothetical protein